MKGVAEREVKADLAIWPINVVGADNQLTVAHTRLQSSMTSVRESRRNFSK